MPKKQRRRRRRTTSFERDIMDMSKTVLDVSVSLAVLNTVAGVARDIRS